MKWDLDMDIQLITKTSKLFMFQQKDESLIRDVRFWLALIVLGALLSFLIISYPGH